MRAPAAPRRRLRTPLVALAGLLLLATLGTQPARAQSVDDKRAEAARVADRLDELEARQMALGAEYERATFELRGLEDEVAEAEAAADQARAEAESRRADLQRFAVDAYISGDSSGSGVDTLLVAEPNEAPQARAYVKAAHGSRQDLIDSLGAAEQQAQEQAATLDAKRGEAQAKADRLRSAAAEADAAADEQRALKAKIDGEVATLVAEEQARREAAAAAAARAAAASTPSPGASAPASRSTAPRSTAPTAPVAPGDDTPAPPAPPARGDAAGAISFALSKVGSPYSWGAEGPNAFDCSGLLVWAFRQVGISLPHYSGAMYSMTARISASQLQPGDFVFWGSGGSEHVALYMGGNQLVHAYRSGGVGVTPLHGWWKPPTGYGRLR